MAIADSSGRPGARATGFTPREDEILSLIAAGLPNKMIARRLGIRPRTVATHLERLFARRQVHSRAEALADWLRHNVERTGAERRTAEVG